MHLCLYISKSSFLVVFELEDQGSHILPCILPLLYALLSIWVELFFLIVKQSSIWGSLVQLTNVLIFSSFLSVFVLILLVLLKLWLFNANFFLLNLFTSEQFVVTSLPELGVIFFLLQLVLLIMLLLFNLMFPWFFNSLLKLQSPSLLCFKYPAGLILSFGHLLV